MIKSQAEIRAEMKSNIAFQAQKVPWTFHVGTELTTHFDSDYPKVTRTIVQSPKRFTESELMRQRLFDTFGRDKTRRFEKRTELKSRARIVTKKNSFRT